MIRFIILLGYFALTLYLQLSGKLSHYINLHYSYLVYISMVLSLLLALVQFYIWIKKINSHSHLESRRARQISILLLSLPLLIGVAFPTVSLDSRTVSAKGYHFPLAAGSTTSGTSSDGTRVQYLKPDTSLYFTKSAYQKEMRATLKKYKGSGKLQITTQNYMEVMEIIYLFPDEFKNRQIEYVGFIYNDPKDKNSQFLFRFGIIHCIADSGVYGLLTTGGQTHYQNNTWVTVSGKLAIEYNQNLKQTLPVLHISQSSQTMQPKNPYVYRVF